MRPFAAVEGSIECTVASTGQRVNAAPAREANRPGTQTEQTAHSAQCRGWVVGVSFVFRGAPAAAPQIGIDSAATSELTDADAKVGSRLSIKIATIASRAAKKRKGFNARRSRPIHAPRRLLQ